MSGRITSCCVALLLTFTMVSAVQRVLRSINDLPMDSRELLHWFANETDIDTNGVIRLTFGGDYGSHHYYNSERLLDPLPWGYQYYTLGNINQRTSQQVPSQGRNKARNIIRVREQNTGSQSQIIDQVYITRHYQEFDHHRSAYDPDQTYEITTSLLREIRGFRIDIDNRYRTDNPPIYTANYVGSANTSQTPLNNKNMK
uniref:Uncharacterized protein n=1 Tax=Amphilophus citrinellus TaxID=61819 RepID=A0A3Q0T872_AMPCI